MDDRRIATALFALAFVPVAYFYGGWGANQEVNYALTRAIVEARTFQVDRFTVHDGDIADGVGGHIYSNKPPGLSVLGAIPYSVQYPLQQRRIVRFRDYWRTNKQLVTIAICGVAGALIPAVLYLYGRRRLGVSRMHAAGVAIVIAFGTIVFPYSTMFFAHVPSALFLLLALTLLRSRPLLAGAAAGVAGACFLISAIAALVLAGLAWKDSAKKALLFVAGGVPFAIGLAAYQGVCFGSPFVTAVERSGSFTEKGLLLGVFGGPQLTRLWGLTFSEYRGLFFGSPVLLFAIAGLVLMVRQRRFRAEAIAIGAIALLFLLLNASFNGWHGGAAYGPRYLLPVIPLLGIAMMLVADRFRLLWILGGVLSIALNLAVTAVDPMPLDGVEHPVTQHILPKLRDEVSLAQDAGNLGERFLGKGNNLTILPAAFWILAGGCFILARARAGGTMTGGCVGTPASSSPSARSRSRGACC